MFFYIYKLYLVFLFIPQVHAFYAPIFLENFPFFQIFLIKVPFFNSLFAFHFQRIIGGSSFFMICLTIFTSFTSFGMSNDSQIFGDGFFSFYPFILFLYCFDSIVVRFTFFFLFFSFFFNLFTENIAQAYSKSISIFFLLFYFYFEIIYLYNLFFF